MLLLIAFIINILLVRFSKVTKLRSLFTRNFSLEEFLYPVFKEINYLTYEEMKSLNLQIQKLAEELCAG